MHTVLAQSATQLAVSSPRELDLPGLVALIIEQKTKFGENGQRTISTGRGKQTVFASVCAFVKSLRQINRTERLPVDEADRASRGLGVHVPTELDVRTAVDEAFEREALVLLREFERKTFKSGGLRSKVLKTGAIEREALATMSLSRDCRNTAEMALSDLLTISKLEERVDRILDKPARDDEDRENLSRLNRTIEKLRAGREALINPPPVAVSEVKETIIPDSGKTIGQATIVDGMLANPAPAKAPKRSRSKKADVAAQ